MTTEAGARTARSWYRKQALGIAARRFAAPPHRTIAGSRSRCRNPQEPRAGLSGALWHDLRHAWRVVRHQPALSLTVVLVLAVAIAANGTVFSVADALVLRPFRYPGVDRAVVLASDGHKRFFARQSVTPGDFIDWREQAGDAFSRLAALEWWDPDYSHDGPPQQLAGFRVSASAVRHSWRARGTRTHAARVRRGGRRGGRRPEPRLLGAPVRQPRRCTRQDHLARHQASPRRRRDAADFTVPFGAEVWAPLAFAPEARSDRTDQHLMVVAQLAPGVSAEASEQRLLAILAQQKKRVSRRRTPGAKSACDRSPKASATRARVRSSPSGKWRRSCCCSWHARTSPTCCSRATPNGSASWRSGWRSARAPAASPGSSCSKSLVLAAGREPSFTAAGLGRPAGHSSVDARRHRPVRARHQLHGVQPATLLATTLLAVCATVIAAMIPALRASRGSMVESLRAGHACERRCESPAWPRGAGHRADRPDAGPARHGGPEPLGVVSRQQRAARVRYRRHPDGKHFTAGHALRGRREAAPVRRFRAPAAFGAAIGRRRGGHHEPAVWRRLQLRALLARGCRPARIDRRGRRPAGHHADGAHPVEGAACWMAGCSPRPIASEAPPVALVNQALAEKLWKSTNVVGRRFCLRPDAPPVTVVGVVGDVAQDWIVGDSHAERLSSGGAGPAGLVRRHAANGPRSDPARRQPARGGAGRPTRISRCSNVRTMGKVVEDKTVGLRIRREHPGDHRGGVVPAVVGRPLQPDVVSHVAAHARDRRARRAGRHAVGHRAIDGNNRGETDSGRHHRSASSSRTPRGG